MHCVSLRRRAALVPAALTVVSKRPWRCGRGLSLTVVGVVNAKQLVPHSSCSLSARTRTPALEPWGLRKQRRQVPDGVEVAGREQPLRLLVPDSHSCRPLHEDADRVEEAAALHFGLLDFAQALDVLLLLVRRALTPATSGLFLLLLRLRGSLWVICCNATNV